MLRMDGLDGAMSRLGLGGLNLAYFGGQGVLGVSMSGWMHIWLGFSYRGK